MNKIISTEDRASSSRLGFSLDARGIGLVARAVGHTNDIESTR